MPDLKKTHLYRIARTSKVLVGKARKEPIAYPKRVAKMIATDPRRVVRMALGREANPAIIYALENRAEAYAQWIAENEPKESDLQQQREAYESFKKKPLISILTPVFNPPVAVLEELVLSVLEQTYPNFELCLGDFGESQDVSSLLKKYAKQDDRVKVYTFKTNKGISGNSNELLKKVKGDYVGLLDHDDTISPDALYENVKLINEGNYDFIYSDKDLMDNYGTRYEPLFKPELSHETMLNANYLTHFDVMRTSILRRIGGWDSKTDGAQDWDLFLRFMQATEKFAHIPKILYHWRVIATSTAHSIDTKPYALEGQRVAVQKYLDSNNIKAKVYHKKSELLLKWLPEAIDEKPVLVILGNKTRSSIELIAQLKKVTPKNSYIAVVFKGVLGTKDTEKLRACGADHMYSYSQGELGSALNKLIADIEKAHGINKTVMFIEDTIKLHKDFDYQDLTGWLSISGVGAVGLKIVDERSGLVADCGSIISDSGVVPLFKQCPSYYHGYLGNIEWVRNSRLVSRSLFAAKANALKLTGFSEEHNDQNVITDMMLRLSVKNRLVTNPKVTAYTDVRVLARADQSELLPAVSKILAKEPLKGTDRYSTPNVQKSNPMLLHTNISTEAAIKVTDVKKSFKLPHEKTNSVKGLVLTAFRRKRTYEKQEVLKGVSFEIKKGEFFGIVGRNGSGKSTLLKLLAGIYTPDSGSIEVNGKLTPFIELGVGFNPELSGRENVYLNGALFGFSREEMDAMYDDIVAFAELERFMDQKLKNYSSGMQVRLAFSIAIRANTDILILDEVLAVGDAAFQQKCFDYFELMKRSRKTVVLVTHDMGAVKRFCTRGVLIENGKIKSSGTSEEIADQYLLDNVSPGINRTDGRDIVMSSLVDELSVSLASNKRSFNHTQTLEFIVRYRLTKEFDATIGFAITKDGISVIEMNTNKLNLKTNLMRNKLYYKLPLKVLNPGVYKIDVAIFKKQTKEIAGYRLKGAEFIVEGYDDSRGGVIRTEGEWLQ